MVALSTSLLFTAFAVAAVLLPFGDASHVERADLEKRHHLLKRGNLAPARGAGLLITTTSTVPLAYSRGRATTASTQSSTKTTSSKMTSTTAKSTSISTFSTAKTTTVKSTVTSKLSSSSSSTKTTAKTTSTKISATSPTRGSTSTAKPPSTSKTSTTTSKISTSKTTMTSSSAKPTYPASKKKGLSYNDPKYTKLFGNSASWAYNWYSTPNADLTSSIEYTPMLWSNATDLTSIWANNVKAEKARGGTHLLGFNEPDLGEQANMTVSQSAQAWKQYMEPYKKDFKLVSPAVTNGGSPMGVAYMQNFLAKCTSCEIDAVALHWYDAAWNTGYFFNYLNDAIKAFSPLPIWLTEFRGSGTAAEQIKFINTVVPWLEQQPQIERYALFGLFEGAAADGNMITNGTLNEVGLAYANAL